MQPTTLKAHSEHVHRFARQIPNLGRIGELTRAILDMFHSGDWRAFADALGQYQFRPGEFDYFLALQSVDARDVTRLYPEAKLEIAPAMDSNRQDRRYRRTLEAVADAHPHARELLLEHWTRYAWGTIATPVGTRALVRARAGKTFEARARDARLDRLKESRNGWRDRIDRVLAAADKLNRDELLEVIDELKKLTRLRKTNSDAWRKDAQELRWSPADCAARWKVSKTAAQSRLGRLKLR